MSYVPNKVVVSGNRSSTLGGTGANLVVLPSQPQPFQSYHFRMATSIFPYEGSCAYDLFRSQGTIGMVYKISSLLTFKKSTDYTVIGDIRNVLYPCFVLNILGILENYPQWDHGRFNLSRLPRLLSVLLQWFDTVIN